MRQRERQTPSEALDIETIEASRARGTFRETLDSVAFGGRRLVIERNGRPVAALVPLGDLEHLRAYDVQRAERMAGEDVHDDEAPTLTVEESLAALAVDPSDTIEGDDWGSPSGEPLTLSLELTIENALIGTGRVTIPDDLSRQILKVKAVTLKKREQSRQAEA